MNIKLFAFCTFLLVFILSFAQEDNKATMSSKTLKEEKIIVENEILLAKNDLLEKHLEYTKTIIDQQNAQISKMSSHFQLFWGITAVILALIGFVMYVQYIKPAKELKAESKELLKESQAILDNIKGEITKVIKENFEEIERGRFDAAIKMLKYGDHFSQNDAVATIKDFKVKGFNDYQLSIIVEVLSNCREDIVKDPNSWYRKFMKDLSEQKSNKILDDFFSRFVNETKTMSIRDAFYYYINNNSINYKNDIHKVFMKKDSNGNTFFLSYFMQDIENATKTDHINFEILNDKDFVDKMEGLGLLNELIMTHEKYMAKGVTKAKNIYEQWSVLERPSYLKERIDSLLKANENSK